MIRTATAATGAVHGMLIACICVLAAPACYGQNAVADLVVNGSFEQDANRDGWADGWEKREGADIRKEGGNAWLRLTGSYASASQKVPLKPEWWKLHLTMRMRATDVVVGKESWQDARLAMSFHAADGKRVGQWPNVFHAAGSTDWLDCDRVYPVPRGADYLVLNPANYGPQGVAEFDDIRIVVAGERPTGKADRPVPAGAGDPWDPTRAWSRSSATREQVCINGLWRFRPVLKGDPDGMPVEGDCWGWFKVPGIWPATDSWSLSTQAQHVLLAPWHDGDTDLRGVDQAWYKRRINIPASWKARRVWVDFTMLQTHARVTVDGEDAGELWFPGGRLDITEFVQPGQSHTLAMLVTARPLESESRVFMAPDRIIKSKASVKLRGVTGDVFLAAEPARDALTDVHLITSTREKRITVSVGLRDTDRSVREVELRITRDGQHVKQFDARSATRRGDRLICSWPWADPDLWDTHTPRNLYDAIVCVRGVDGQLLDESLPVHFGFREFWIDGRDFYLNGKRMHLRALHNRSINDQADKACRDGARNTCRRMQEYGFNFLITGNYNFSPGEVGYMDGLFEATDETGMLASFSLPHVKDFKWKLSDADVAARYRELCSWLVRRVQNHPSIVMYAMNHNATGYYGDQNPLKIDGVYDPDEAATRPPYSGTFSRSGARAQAKLAAAIARALDPTRPIYHHQSGNLGDMHTVNIYLNWAPKQERSDWLEHWAETGVKPLFFVEWGVPHISSWSSYRGPQFIWRCEAFQQLWDSEFAAAYVGEGAYRMTEQKVKALDHEEKLWAGGEPFRWSTLKAGIDGVEQNHLQVKTWFVADNWRSHRTWGASAMLPWDQADMWRRVRQTPVADAPARYNALQAPGIRPDAVAAGSQFIYDRQPGAFEPTSLGRAFRRWNQPAIAFIGGEPGRFTEKGHNVLPGATVRKQLVVVNDSRRDVRVTGEWSLDGRPFTKPVSFAVGPGDKAFAPVSLPLPADIAPGEHSLSVRVRFERDTPQEDAFAFHVLAPPPSLSLSSRFGLFDPEGRTSALLDRLGVAATRVRAGDSLDGVDVLILGRRALSGTAALPGLDRVRNGLKVLVFEQEAAALQNRLGLRINVHGLRETFPRVPSHPVLSGLSEANLRDWRGAATLVPPHLDTDPIEERNPTWSWCGLRNTRVWRCGNRGCVASVLIEKPPCGNWLPIVDGGFDLQYAPLLEVAEGNGRIVFCQLDVTGRSTTDPAADRLCRNLLAYLDKAEPAAHHPVAYAGDGRGAGLLASLGVRVVSRDPAPGDLVVVGPGAPDQQLKSLADAARDGQTVLGLGLSGAELGVLLASPPETRSGPALSALLPVPAPAEFAGLSSADLHWRTKPEMTAFTDDAAERNNALRVLRVGAGRIVLCQVAPWMFDTHSKPYVRTTARRTTFLVSRLLANLGAEFATPLLERMAQPAAAWEHALAGGWVGKVDREDLGRDQQWWQPQFDDSAWQPIAVPGPPFDQQREGLADYNGLFWYRVRFTVPAAMGTDRITLRLGPVDDESWVWLNGTFLGEVTKTTNPDDYWSFPREFTLDPGLLEPGRENVLAVRVNDTYRTGGVTGKPRLTRPAPWLTSYYVQTPIAVDDPYRYYRW